MQSEILILRLIHVLGGIFWVGAHLFTMFFLMPAFASAGPAAGPVMAGLQQRRLYAILPVVAVLTLLSGLRLMQLTSGGFSAAYFDPPAGKVFAGGGVAAIAAFVIGMIFARPAAARMGRLAAAAASAPPEDRERNAAELTRLRGRIRTSGLVVAVLLIGAAAAMATARYA
jgi:uncharacterized membrane protein